MDRVRELIVQISTHEKEIQAMKKAAEESIKKKDDRMKRVLAREAEIKKKNGEQKAIIKNLASIWKSRRIGQKFIRKEDLQRNLKLLEEAMKANEISSDLHQVSVKHSLSKSFSQSEARELVAYILPPFVRILIGGLSV